MISLSHWGCFFIEYPRGYSRFGKASTEWYFINYIEWGNNA